MLPFHEPTIVSVSLLELPRWKAVFSAVDWEVSLNMAWKGPLSFLLLM